jgi:hypothetical protein
VFVDGMKFEPGPEEPAVPGGGRGGAPPTAGPDPGENR